MSNPINDDKSGGPAFPHGNETHGGCDGMSVRMWLAGRIMSSMFGVNVEMAAEEALAYADALIKAIKK